MENTDLVLVNRDTKTYQQPVGEIMAKLEDTDLLLVNRDVQTYTITGAEFKSSITPDPIAPDSSDIAISPTVPGSGTVVDPYVLRVVEVFGPGNSGETVEVITISNQVPEAPVIWDVRSSTPTSSAFLQPTGEVDSEGSWSGKFVYADLPVTVADQERTGILQIGSIYFKWVVEHYLNSGTAPEIESVTVTKITSNSGRFTDNDFRIQLAMSEEGNPSPEKEVVLRFDGVSSFYEYTGPVQTYNLGAHILNFNDNPDGWDNFEVGDVIRSAENVVANYGAPSNITENIDREGWGHRLITDGTIPSPGNNSSAFSWTIPQGANYMSVICIGGGGGSPGAAQMYGGNGPPYNVSGGGGGGGTAYHNSVTVFPGQTVSGQVGKGSNSFTNTYPFTKGGDSYLDYLENVNSETVVRLLAEGGNNGNSISLQSNDGWSSSASGGNGGSVAAPAGATGYSGGQGGSSSIYAGATTDNTVNYSFSGGGGGGAGGATGSGGNGGNAPTTSRPDTGSPRIVGGGYGGNYRLDSQQPAVNGGGSGNSGGNGGQQVGSYGGGGGGSGGLQWQGGGNGSVVHTAGGSAGGGGGGHGTYQNGGYGGAVLIVTSKNNDRTFPNNYLPLAVANYEYTITFDSATFQPLKDFAKVNDTLNQPATGSSGTITNINQGSNQITVDCGASPRNWNTTGDCTVSSVATGEISQITSEAGNYSFFLTNDNERWLPGAMIQGPNRVNGSIPVYGLLSDDGETVTELSLSSATYPFKNQDLLYFDIKFPSLMEDGETPDTNLPYGSALVAEVTSTNSQGSDTDENPGAQPTMAVLNFNADKSVVRMSQAEERELFLNAATFQTRKYEYKRTQLVADLQAAGYTQNEITSKLGN